MGPPDDEIIRNIRGGATREFARLVDRYKERAMTLSVRMLRNREDAEEAVQDAFVRAYRALAGFEGASKFGTWLYRIVYNVCLTRIGRSREEYHRLDDVEEGEIEDDESPGPHELLETKDLVERMRELIAGMPERYSVILSLFYFQQLSYQEIRDITGMPLGTVKAHLFRSRSMLQRRLMEQLQEVRPEKETP